MLCFDSIFFATDNTNFNFKNCACGNRLCEEFFGNFHILVHIYSRAIPHV